MIDFNKQVVVITGAASGIGRCLAIKLAAKGAKLALSDINPNALQSLAQELATSTDVIFEAFDVSQREAFSAFAERVDAEMGGATMVINNAGVTVAASVAETSIQDAKWLMDINFWGVFHGTQLFLPQVKRSQQGAVVNISSVFGIIAFPGQSLYNASKFAVKGFTEALRHEMSLDFPNILISTVHPGGVGTNIAKSARAGGDHSVVSHEKLQRDFAKSVRTTADEAAQIIIDGIEAGDQQIIVGRDAKALRLLARLSPVNYFKWLSRLKILG